MRKIYILPALYVSLILVLIISGCTSSNHSLKCPDLAYKKSQPGLLVRSGLHSKHSGTTKNSNTTSATTIPTPLPDVDPLTPAPADELMASTSNEFHFKIAVPKYMTKRMPEDELGQLNNSLHEFSNNKVTLIRNENGKVLLAATSAKEVLNLANTVREKGPALVASGGNTDLLAFIGGIMGIVAAGLGVIPYLHIISLAAGIAGIVLGVMGLHSGKPLWAKLGIGLGAAGIVLAVMTIVLYVFFIGIL